MIRRAPILALAAIFCTITALGAENLVVNGDFEKDLSGWNRFWSRTPGGSAAVQAQKVHGGRQAVRIEHTGSADWSFQQTTPLRVKPGDIYELSGWVRVEGQGNVSLCVTLYDAAGKAVDWSYGESTSTATDAWRPLRSRFIVPAGTATMLPRFIGYGAATVWADDVVLVRSGSLDALRAKGLPEKLTVANNALQLELQTADATFSLTDRRTGRTWSQRPGGHLAVLDARPAEGGLDLRLLDPASMLTLQARLRLEKDRPEVTVELDGKGSLPRPLAFPAPFVTDPGTFLIVPVNEGISYPVDDATLGPMSYILYGGHGICMAWWGATDGQRGVMAIVETPDDAGVRLPRVDGRLCLAPEWHAERGQFGPARRIRYVALDSGGYVAMAKRYRQYVQTTGLFKTLAQKRAENPNVDLLIGAVNVWSMGGGRPAELCREMQSLGIDRILWSAATSPEELKKLNAMGVLTSRYDIYQDSMNPADFPKLQYKHGDWTSEAWAKGDLVLDSRGNWERGWEVEGKDGKMYPCGVLCDRQAVDYARKRIPPELQTHPYRCRFIDTTTAAPWRECYDPRHPMTRSESRKFKMDLLDFVSRDCRLVCGSETGHDAAVPFVHYFEGMLSLGPYRVSDSGRNMLQPVLEVPERVAKFQTGHYYRLPLWELVYHDCVVSQWYWGDYNNKLPSLWDRRDLWNALYGTPPMFMFNKAIWEKNRERFVQSYKTIAPAARATGYAEMLSHRWLTKDHSVQETQFAGGVRVTVNFGDKPFTMEDGTVLKPLGQRTEGIKGR